MSRETIRRLKATGTAVADLEVVAFRPETEIGVFSTLFDAAAELGAKHVLVACYDPDLARFSDRFARILRNCVQLRVDVGSRIHALDRGTGSKDGGAHRGGGRSLRGGRSGRRAAFRQIRQSHRGPPRHSGSTPALLADLRWPRRAAGSTEELIHAAREERLFPGEGGIDLVRLAMAMPADLTISVEVPTVQLTKRVNAETRARRALQAAKGVVEAARGRSTLGADRRA